MSLSSLPVELLNKITVSLKKESQEDQDFYARHTLPDGGIDCVLSFLKPLASVNSRMCAVVSPLLFSQVTVIEKEADDSPRLLRLNHLLSMRPHIARLCKYVRSYSPLDQSSTLS